MVQRKASPRLGQQADHVKRQSLMQHQEVKGRAGAADLMKKKMKKSASIKRPEAEAVRSTRHVKEKQPGEPPTPPGAAVVADAVTPQKHSPGSSLAKTPNYMKSTSSSDARKEKSGMSIKSSSIGTPDCSNLSGKGSKSLTHVTVGSGNKATKTLTRSGSLKSMRISTKNSGFKIARVSVKKCSPVALCENLDAQKATCSSTLKDSKFPAYLALNPGGTEAEGTSAIKVCPYNFCSLNGHRHDPSPPLKCFLSARRLTVKAQRGIKLGCLSPRRGKLNGSDPYFGEKVVQDEVESPRICAQSEEEHRDFFVEIFCKNMEETGVDRKGSYSPVVDLLPAVDASSVTAAEEKEEQVPKMFPDAPDTLDQNGELNLVQEGTKLLDDVDSDASDVEQETGYLSVLYLDYDHAYLPDAMTEIDAKNEGCPGEIMDDKVSQQSFDEVASNLDAFSSSDDSESTCSYDYLQSSYNMETSAHVEVPVEEPERASSDGENQTFSGSGEATGLGLPIGSEVAGYQIMAEKETSFNDLKCEFLQDDDAEAETGDQVSISDGTVTFGGEGNCDPTTDNVMSEKISLVEGCELKTELSDEKPTNDTDDFGTSSLVDPPKQYDSTEVECNVADKVETEDAAIAAGGDQDNSTEAFVTSNLVDPEQASDFLVALLRSTELERDMADNVEEAAIAEGGDQDKSTEDFINLSFVAPEKDSDFVVALLRSNEVKRSVLDKLKAEDASKPGSEDSGLALYITKCKKPIKDDEEFRPFNPRGPNFLPLEPDPEAEKVDLRHQELDERKNTEEYLVDYALRQAVTKLAPARKRKVALLVEAFEKVMPISKWEVSPTPGAALDVARPIQACR